jgi:ABC-2 type transport system ATP-binding protein
VIEALSRKLPMLTLATAILFVPQVPDTVRRAPILEALALAVCAATGLFVLLARRLPAAVLPTRARSRLLVERLLFLAAVSASEEVIWRWFVVGGLADAADAGAALVIGTVGFAGAHRWRGRRAFAVHCATGATFGAVFLLTGSLLAAIVCHVAYNALVALAIESRAVGASRAQAATVDARAHPSAGFGVSAVSREESLPVASLEHVSKRYGTNTALDDLNLEVQPGEIVALLGPNGAGKTTAIGILLGLRRPTDGRARLFGRDPQTASVRVRVGATPQEAGFPPTLTVDEVLRFVCGHYPAAAARQQLLAEFGLTRLARRQTGGLSGGQKRRLALAAAFAGNPAAVFLDEPTVGLDVEARRSSWATIRRFQEGGGTVLFSTHYLEEVDALASRVIVLSDGVIVADGAPSEIRARTGLKYVRLRACELPPLAAATRIVREAGSLTIFTRDAGRLMYELVSAGVALADLEVQPTSLEDALIALTGGAR